MDKIILLCLCLFDLLCKISSVVSRDASGTNIQREVLKHADLQKKVITTSDALKPIGPYNQAIQLNGILYLSDHIGIDPATGQLISDDVRDQTREIFRNIRAVLHAAGANSTQITRCLVLLTDINDFRSMNEIYLSSFPSMEHYPARTTLAVAVLPANAKIEIKCTAYTKEE